MGQNHNSKQLVQNWHTYEKNTIKYIFFGIADCADALNSGVSFAYPVPLLLIIYNPFSIFTFKNNGKNTLTLRIGQHTLDLASCTGSLSPMIIWAAWMKMELIVDMQDLD